jgi:hypothetical protein
MMMTREDTPGEKTYSFALSRGTLNVVTAAHADLSTLMDVAERENPKRAFLFVSKVLGRHIPVSAKTHRDALRSLMVGFPGIGAEPAVVMGFAETAVGLGAGVHDEITKVTGRDDIVYLPSTRHTGGHTPWISFTEGHSHAPDHVVLMPAPAIMKTVMAARTLILVDDEASTGKTFAAIVDAIVAARGASFDRIILVTLTDWSGGMARQYVAKAAGLSEYAVHMQTLACGAYSFTPDVDAAPVQLPESCTPLQVTDLVFDDANWRFGQPALAASLHHQSLHAGSRVLVIGCGEFAWPAFRLAEDLERCGHAAAFIATTRSPVLPGKVITHKATFADHYGLGIEMYLHNVDPAVWDSIVVLGEGSADRIDRKLAAYLGNFIHVAPDGVNTHFSRKEVAA